MRGDFKSFSLIFAFAYAIAGLIFFIDLFFAFLLGNSVRYQEPNKIVAFVELLSALISFFILMIYFLNFSSKNVSYSLR